MLRKIKVNESKRVSSMKRGDYFKVTCAAKLNYTYYIVKAEGRAVFIVTDDRNLDGSETNLLGEFGMPYSWILFPETDDCVLDVLKLAQLNTGLSFSIDEDSYAVSNSENMSVISDKYEKESIYKGVHGYHNSHRSYMNKPLVETDYKIGVELEVECVSESYYEDLKCDFSSNWLHMERDGSLNEYGIEFITVPLNKDDAKSAQFWKPLTDLLTGKAISWDSSSCGLHVHIGREILGKTDEQKSETIGKMLYLYHYFLKHESMNSHVYGRERGYSDSDGKCREGDAVVVLGGSSLLKIKSVKERLDKGLKDRSNSGRYFDINIQNANTIEFRRGKGSLNENRIAAVVEYSEAIVKYSKSASWSKISLEGFKKYLSKHVKESSPLRGYISGYVSFD